jgi:hypothetical protein
MDINFHDPNDIPLPPKEVRVRQLRVEPLPDQKRVRVFIELTPFQQKPNCEIKIINRSGLEAASLSIIEAIDRKMEFTIHLKKENAPGEYTALLDVYYFEEETPEESSGEQAEETLHQLPERIQMVDQQEAEFSIADQKGSE